MRFMFSTSEVKRQAAIHSSDLKMFVRKKKIPLFNIHDILFPRIPDFDIMH